MITNLKSFFKQSAGDCLGELFAAALDVDVADTFVDIVFKVKPGFFAVFWTLELTGNGTGFFGFGAWGKGGVGKSHKHTN